MRYNKANGWPNKEAFLFEFDFYYGNKLYFKATVSPPIDYVDYDEKLVQILNTVKGVRTSLGEKWKVFFIEETGWELEKNVLSYNEDLSKTIDHFIDKMTPRIEAITNAILDHKDELLTLKEIYERNND